MKRLLLLFGAIALQFMVVKAETQPQPKGVEAEAVIEKPLSVQSNEQDLKKLPAGTFVCKDINGKEVRLSDFKGKYILVDIWATWCGPCKGELPSLAKQEKAFEGKNVVFLSISVDKDVKKWGEFVKEKKLKGVQVNAGKAAQEIAKLYNVRGIPRFMLLGKDGKVVDGNFLRPSNKDFASTLKREIAK